MLSASPPFLVQIFSTLSSCTSPICVRRSGRDPQFHTQAKQVTWINISKFWNETTFTNGEVNFSHETQLWWYTSPKISQPTSHWPLDISLNKLNVTRNDNDISASPHNIGIYIWCPLSITVITWRWPLLAETCSYFFAIKYHHKTYHHSCVSWLKFTSPLVFLHTTGMTYLKIETTFRSIIAMVAQPKSCLFQVNTRTELKKK